jgi:hypothetical protein
MSGRRARHENSPHKSGTKSADDCRSGILVRDTRISWAADTPAAVVKGPNLSSLGLSERTLDLLVPRDPSSTLTAPHSPQLDATGQDPDLAALPAPPKGERTATVLMMALTAIAAGWMSFVLLGEAKYALTPGQLADVSDLATLSPTADLDNRYVRATGLLGTTGAIRYGRAAEGDSFRLAPIAGNNKIWVEIRVPEGFEGPRFVPPTNFAGRLVPFKKAGIRHTRLPESVGSQTDKQIPNDAWVLIDGSSPRASRWAIALVLLFLGFSLWNVAGIARVLGRVRDPKTA